MPILMMRCAGVSVGCYVVCSIVLCATVEANAQTGEAPRFGVMLGDSVDQLKVAYPNAEPVPGADGIVQGYRVKVSRPLTLARARSARLWFAVSDGRVTYIAAELHGISSFSELNDEFEKQMGKVSLIRTTRYRGWFGTNYCITSGGWPLEHGQALWLERGTWRRGPTVSVENYAP
jgi:hypothetical protein